MDDIPFPFEPYEEQRALMKQIYTTMDDGGIALLESPTGTGKSLSIICSALHWLVHFNKNKHRVQSEEDKETEETSSRESTPDWVNAFFDKEAEKEKVNLFPFILILCLNILVIH